MNLQDRINLIKEAIHKVQLASDLVQEALEGTNLTSHYEAYGVCGKAKTDPEMELCTTCLTQ